MAIQPTSTAARSPSPQPGNAASGTREPPADRGLLVIHGVGAHEATTTIRGFIAPFLARLHEEGSLVNTSTCIVGNEDVGEFDAVRVRYRPTPAGEERSLLVVEGRWDGEYRKEGAGNVSSWATRSAPRMIWQVWLHHARWQPDSSFWGGLWSCWRAALSLATLVLLAAAVLKAGDGTTVGLSYLLGALLVSLPGAFNDSSGARAAWGDAGLGWFQRKIYGLALAGTLIIYQLQRAIVLIVTAAAIVIAPVLFMMLRWLANIPLVSDRVVGGGLQKLEAGLMLGGFADMQAVVGNEVTAAAIRTRVRRALVELEAGVAVRGPITVLAHSGGAPVAWSLLSEPEIVERQRHHPHSYRLITAGAALNWARRGFEDKATTLDLPLVNHARPFAEQTVWANVWSAWDPVPHGHTPRGDFSGYRTLPGRGDDPNVMVRNLGAPVPEEHGEYWRNQQEFVPLLAQCIDDELGFVPLLATEPGIWANCRLALLSTLVRVRLMVLALPFAALVAGLRGVNFLPATHANGSTVDRPFLVEWIGKGLEALVKGSVGADRYTDARAFLDTTPVLTGLIVTVILFLAALALMDVFTNICWHRLGRRVRPFTPKLTGAPPRWAIPVGAGLWLAIPAAVIVPVLFWQLPIERSTFWALCGTHWALMVADTTWLNRCIRALARDENELVKRAFSVGAGRMNQRTSADATVQLRSAFALEREPTGVAPPAARAP